MSDRLSDKASPANGEYVLFNIISFKPMETEALPAGTCGASMQRQKNHQVCFSVNRDFTGVEEMTDFKIPESVLVVIHTLALDVLLIRRADAAEFWQSVTGSKDHPEEDLAYTAAREVGEETGIDCMPGSPLAANLCDWQLQNVYDIYPQWRARYGPGVTRNTEHLFGLCVPERIVPVLAPREHIDWKWLPFRDAADACFSPSNAEAILLLPQFAP